MATFHPSRPFATVAVEGSFGMRLIRLAASFEYRACNLGRYEG